MQQKAEVVARYLSSLPFEPVAWQLERIYIRAGFRPLHRKRRMRTSAPAFERKSRNFYVYVRLRVGAARLAVRRSSFAFLSVRFLARRPRLDVDFLGELREFMVGFLFLSQCLLE